MAIKKSELYSSIWASCDELRGGMDASQYKDYVLVLLFVKYVSDKYAGQKNPLIVIPKGGSFKDMIAAKGDKDIGNKMNVIIAALAKENGLKGVIDLTDFNDPDKLGKGKEMVDRLSKLVAIFENPALDFTRNRAEGDDLLGDAYEYLMRHFATESGKSKGQFYTPAEVSRIMAKVIGVSEAKSANTTIYDPTCGSGSLLLKAADEAKVKISIYGQEMDNSTAGLARMNMILHDNPSAEIEKIKGEVDHFEKARMEIKLASGDYIDLKMYEPAMRHLIDTYIRAEESRKVSAFDDLTLIQLIVERGEEAFKEMPAGIAANPAAMAETIENNLRRVIIDEQPINPKYYEKMSELLDTLIQERKAQAHGYEEYLKRYVDLSKQVTNPSGGVTYPKSLNNSARRALYDNLGKDEELAVALDREIRTVKKDDWRGHKIKEREVLYAIQKYIPDEAEAERIFNLVSSQPEY